jgi:hypothetical protein
MPAAVPAPDQRLAASVARWESIRAAYAARGMKSYQRRAEKTLRSLRNALAAATQPADAPVKLAPSCAMCGDVVRPGEGAEVEGVGAVHDTAARDCRTAAAQWYDGDPMLRSAMGAA